MLHHFRRLVTWTNSISLTKISQRSDLWLNEGFATWIQYVSIDKCFPQWSAWNYFPIEIQSNAYDYDCFVNSHPIQTTGVIGPQDLYDIFNDITYSKGACVIRMLEQYVGGEGEAFRKAMRSYFQKFAYKNTITKDLWECFENENTA